MPIIINSMKNFGTQKIYYNNASERRPRFKIPFESKGIFPPEIRKYLRYMLWPQKVVRQML